MFYTYELIDSRDGAVFYVGKGKGNRRFEHEREARSGKPGAKCDRIREIIAGGGSIRASIVERFLDEDAAYEAEAALIQRYGIDNLTNVCVGGRGGRQQIDEVEEAKRTIRKHAAKIRSVLDLVSSGYRLMLGPYDLSECCVSLANRLKERVGIEFFERHVGVV